MFDEVALFLRVLVTKMFTSTRFHTYCTHKYKVSHILHPQVQGFTHTAPTNTRFHTYCTYKYKVSHILHPQVQGFTHTAPTSTRFDTYCTPPTSTRFHTYCTHKYKVSHILHPQVQGFTHTAPTSTRFHTYCTTTPPPPHTQLYIISGSEMEPNSEAYFGSQCSQSHKRHSGLLGIAGMASLWSQSY